MAITVDWPNKIVLIPRGEPTIATLASALPEIWDYDLDLLRKELLLIQESDQGMAFKDIHRHTQPFVIGTIELARVISIINGFVIEFEDGQYQVNLAGANTDIHLNRVANQVSVTPQNSAGLVTTSSSIELISGAVWDKTTSTGFAPGTMGSTMVEIAYGNRIWVDPLNVTGNATAGTVVGVNGTPGNPVLGVPDARVLAASLNLRSYAFFSDAVITSDHPKWDMRGFGHTRLDLAGFNCEHTGFSNLIIEGDALGQELHADHCVLENLTNFTGFFTECGVLTGLSIASGATVLSRCHSEIPGSMSPDITFVDDATLSIRAYSGGMELFGMTDAANICTIEFVAGSLKVGPSNTAGYVSARGIAKRTLTPAGTVVDTSALLDAVTDVPVDVSSIASATADAVWDEDRGNGTFEDMLFGIAKRYSLLDMMVFNANKMMTSARERVFPTRGLADLATPDAPGLEGAIEVYAVVATEGATPGLPASYSRIRTV